MGKKVVLLQAKEHEMFSKNLLGEIKHLIESAKHRIVYTANSELVMMYWKIGERIHNAILQSDRAEYGEQIVATLSQQLTLEYGKGFSIPAITRMIKAFNKFAICNVIKTFFIIAFHMTRRKSNKRHIQINANNKYKCK